MRINQAMHGMVGPKRPSERKRALGFGVGNYVDSSAT